jgi:hypothetical protein
MGAERAPGTMKMASLMEATAVGHEMLFHPKR